MEKKRLYRKHRLFLLSFCCLLFIFSVGCVFTLFQHRLNESFYVMFSGNLEESTQEQKRHAVSGIQDIQGLLASLLQVPEPAGNGVMTDGWEWNFYNDRIQIRSMDAGQIHRLYSRTEQQADVREILDRLEAGEDVITDLGVFGFTEDASCFALLHPVLQDGSLAGLLRAQVDGSLLTAGDMESDSFFQKVYSIIVKSDGSIVYADTPYPDVSNLFSSVLQGGIAPDEADSIRRAFEEKDTGTICFHGKGNQYYMSWTPLEVNDWRIVKFARSPDVVLQTAAISRGMILAGIFLILLTAAFCGALIRLLLHQKRWLETQKRRYEALSQFNDTLLFEYDVVSDLVTLTPNAMERLKLDSGCLEGIPGRLYIQRLIHPDDQEGVIRIFRSSDIVLGETYYLEARLLCRDGGYSWFGCRFKSIENREGCTSRIVGKMVDISDQRGREQLLRQAALADPLTGLYNRGAEELINSRLETEPQGMLFMIDLDNFKTVNDTYGHAAGDALLVGVARILREVFRPDDILVRAGGDEFAVFLSGCNDPKVAACKAGAIQKRMEQLQLPGIVHSVSASIGAASAPKDGTSYGELTRAADQAMYTIKQHSKKGFALHE